MRLLVSREDVTDDVLRHVADTVDGWFPDGPIPTDEFIDRLCAAAKTTGWDIERLDTPAVRRIMRFARATQAELT